MSLSQTLLVNSGSSLFGGEVLYFDGSGGTNDVFDYTSALVAGDGTSIGAGTNITLTELNTQPSAITSISANSTGAIEFNYSEAFLGFDLENATAATVIANIEAILEGSNTISSGGAVTQGGANTDMLFLFYEDASSQGNERDAIIVRYQEGATSEADFAGELSLVVDFENITAGSFTDTSFN